MKVLVTGASGFLGSWISSVLSSEFDVVALIRDSSDSHKLSKSPSVRILRGTEQTWADLIVKELPDIVVLNDWTGVGNEYRNSPVQFDNFRRIQLLAQAVNSISVKTVIGVGSQAELGPISSQISEVAEDNPTTLYGQSKVKCRKILEDMFLNSSSRFVWMRIFSTYGPLDEGRWLIPEIFDSLTSSRSMKMTKGEQEWSYLHAFDLARAFETVINNRTIEGIVNVGNPETITIRKVAETIASRLEKKDLLSFGALDYRTDQVMKLQPLCENLTKAGWSPEITFDQGIGQTLEWLGRKSLTPIRTKSGKLIDFNLPSRR